MTLTSATLNPTTYTFTLADGTATGGTDYTNAPTFSNGVTLAAGVLTVPAGVTTFTVTYPTLTDAIADNGETTTVTVGDAKRHRHDQRPGGTDGGLGDRGDGDRRDQSGPYRHAHERDAEPEHLHLQSG